LHNVGLDPAGLRGAMTWQPTQYTRAQLEERRRAAARLLRAGRLSQAAIAREVGVHRSSVTRWKQQLTGGGLRALRRRRAPGRASHLTAGPWRRRLRTLQRSALAAGFETDRWTRRRIAAVVARRFRVRDPFRSLGRARRARGWSPQQPRPQAKERDDAPVEAWLRRDWPRIKGGLAAAGAPSPSGTRRGTRFGPASAAPGRRAAGRRS
jgi:transposase